ncbi:MAG TPA: aldo/keto reductase [Terracidiphilus sp.]|nr:aldo/keto reductase [Terracidiphilus sp.]
MSPVSRREFLKTSIAVSTVAGAAAAPLKAASTQKATELVTLGKSNLQVTRLALGTGSNNGYVQKALGQQGFNRLVQHAWDRGIRFFETAEAYATPAMLAEALKPYPRESYVLMSKVTTDPGADPAKRFDEMRRISQTDYFDIMLLHYQHTGNWVAESARWRDGINEAQAKQTIKVRGVSVHGLPALRLVPGDSWLQIAMIRMNHNGTRMDGPSGADYTTPGNVEEVVHHVKQVKSEGMGVISMKLAGDGTFTQRSDRQAAVRFAFRSAGVDCVTIGFKSPQEIDEAFDNINLAYV